MFFLIASVKVLKSVTVCVKNDHGSLAEGNKLPLTSPLLYGKVQGFMEEIHNQRQNCVVIILSMYKKTKINPGAINNSSM